jgi:CRISPR-associated protein (TIGR03984 family)
MSEREFSAPITPLTTIDFGDDLSGWLVAQAQAYNLPWLLAHADDGVNWGRIAQGKLTISHDYYAQYAPCLRAETLQQVRLFGEAGELYLWQMDGQWRGRFLAGNADATLEPLSATYLLWGTSAKAAQDGFVLLVDGEQGLCHAPPHPAGFDADRHYLALTVRHYVAYDEDGQAHVAASRLVEITTVDKEQEGAQ